jgi:HD-GYP domain-containing protein (c-di-GMP phosphodiesterase class II)
MRSMPVAVADRTCDSDARRMRNFRCVPLTVFRLHTNVNASLFVKLEGQVEPVLYRSAHIPISEQDIAELKARGHGFLYVSTDEFAAFDKALNETIQENLSNDAVSPEDRFAVLQAATAFELDVAFHLINSDRYVALTQRIARQITTLLATNQIVPRKLFEVLQHDYYTFTHVTNVAAFATLLGDGLGYSEPKVREQIAVGALLHDIGKRFIPAEVLNKTGKLTDDEWHVIRVHPQRGYEELCERPDLTEGQLMMVYSHHERLDGKGYPVGLVDEEIHPLAKLLAVVDVFDAVTSARPYRTPMNVAQGLALLERNAGNHFDREMVTCWLALMKSR